LRANTPFSSLRANAVSEAIPPKHLTPTRTCNEEIASSLRSSQWREGRNSQWQGERNSQWREGETCN